MIHSIFGTEAICSTCLVHDANYCIQQWSKIVFFVKYKQNLPFGLCNALSPAIEEGFEGKNPYFSSFSAVPCNLQITLVIQDIEAGGFW